MKKQTAIEMLGGTPQKAARAMGYKSPHAIYVWPDELSQAMSDQVIGACVRLAETNANSTAESVTPIVPGEALI